MHLSGWFARDLMKPCFQGFTLWYFLIKRSGSLCSFIAVEIPVQGKSFECAWTFNAGGGAKHDERLSRKNAIKWILQQRSGSVNRGKLETRRILAKFSFVFLIHESTTNCAIRFVTQASNMLSSSTFVFYFRLLHQRSTWNGNDCDSTRLQCSAMRLNIFSTCDWQELCNRGGFMSERERDS